MAKAQYHKGQRVFVRSVGTWSQIEKVVPQWVTGVEEPLKIFYEVGLGRPFQGHELVSVERAEASQTDEGLEQWRLLRMRSMWALEGDDPAQPRRESYPVVVTDPANWGGWRVPKAEYDRDPERIEHQARILVNALPMLRLLRDLTNHVEARPDANPELQALADRAAQILQRVHLEGGAVEAMPAPESAPPSRQP